MTDIIRKEILENLTTYRFAVLTGLLALLVAISVIVSYGDYRIRMENYNILRPPADDPSKIILPPEPMSIFARGLDANTGRLYQLSSLGIEVESSQQSINRLFSLFTVPDMLFIIKVMLALVAILFSFDAVCGEKEQGTLKLMLSGHTGRAAIIMGKLAGRYALVFVPFAVLFLVAATAISLAGDVPSGADYWWRVSAILVSAGLHVGAFLAAGTLISSLVSRSPSSLTLGLGVWVLLVFVVPDLSTTAARAISDVPPADRVEMENRLTAVRAIYEALQAAKGGARDMSRIMYQIREGNSQVFETYRPRLNRMIALSQGLARVSPSGALVFFVSEAANTGISTDLHIKDEIWAYIDRNIKRFAGLDPEPPEHFNFRRPALAEQLAGPALPDLIVLVAFPFVLTACALGAFMRYDPR